MREETPESREKVGVRMDRGREEEEGAAMEATTSSARTASERDTPPTTKEVVDKMRENDEESSPPKAGLGDQDVAVLSHNLQVMNIAPEHEQPTPGKGPQPTPGKGPEPSSGKKPEPTTGKGPEPSPGKTLVPTPRPDLKTLLENIRSFIDQKKEKTSGGKDSCSAPSKPSSGSKEKVCFTEQQEALRQLLEKIKTMGGTRLVPHSPSPYYLTENTVVENTPSYMDLDVLIQQYLETVNNNNQAVEQYPEHTNTWNTRPLREPSEHSETEELTNDLFKAALVDMDLGDIDVDEMMNMYFGGDSGTEEDEFSSASSPCYDNSPMSMDSYPVSPSNASDAMSSVGNCSWPNSPAQPALSPPNDLGSEYPHLSQLHPQDFSKIINVDQPSYQTTAHNMENTQQAALNIRPQPSPVMGVPYVQQGPPQHIFASTIPVSVAQPQPALHCSVHNQLLQGGGIVITNPPQGPVSVVSVRPQGPASAVAVRPQAQVLNDSNGQPFIIQKQIQHCEEQKHRLDLQKPAIVAAASYRPILPKPAVPAPCRAPPTHTQPDQLQEILDALPQQELRNARCYVAMMTDDFMNVDSDGDSALHITVAKEDKCSLIAFLDRCVRANIIKESINRKNNLTQTPLFTAALTEDPVIAADLIAILLHPRYNADPTICTYIQDGNTEERTFVHPIHIIATKGNPYAPVMRKLLTRHCQAQLALTCSKRFTALHHAAFSHRFRPSDDVIMALLENGADINAKEGRRGCTPLHIIIETKDVALLNRVLSYLSVHDPESLKMAINNPRYDKDTPLHVAATQEMDLQTHQVLLHLLLRYGADTSLKNGQNRRPCDLLQGPSRELVNLIKGGATQYQRFM